MRHNQHKKYSLKSAIKNNFKTKKMKNQQEKIVGLKWKQNLAMIIFVLSTGVLFASCMNMKHGMKPDMTNRGKGIVWMKQDCFSPMTITIPVNTSVTWINKDWWGHDVTSSENLFGTSKIRHKKTFSYKFTKVGTFHYICRIHKHMAGTVIVQ